MLGKITVVNECEFLSENCSLGLKLASRDEIYITLFCFFIMKLASKSIFVTSAFLMIFNSSVECLRSTNWCLVDIDKDSHCKILLPLSVRNLRQHPIIS